MPPDCQCPQQRHRSRSEGHLQALGRAQQELSAVSWLTVISSGLFVRSDSPEEEHFL